MWCKVYQWEGVLHFVLYVINYMGSGVRLGRNTKRTACVFTMMMLTMMMIDVLADRLL
jgi:hypothetical protein